MAYLLALSGGIGIIMVFLRMSRIILIKKNPFLNPIIPYEQWFK